MVGRGKQCFFDRVVWGGLLGVHHTRGIYAGIKEGQGWGGGGGGSPSPRRACAIFIARTTPACYNNPPTPDLSVNRPGPTIGCGSEPTPFSSNTRTNSGFFVLFFPPEDFFLSFARRRIKICLCRINTNRSTELLVLLSGRVAD